LPDPLLRQMGFAPILTTPIARKPGGSVGRRAQSREPPPGVMVDAVTFDFWNTLMWEEPGSLREKRLEAWADALIDVGDRFDRVQERAHDAAHQQYVVSWTAGRQFRMEDAVEHMVENLGRELGAEAKQALLDGFAEAGRRAAVRVSYGVRECLEALKRAGVRIGIICDIGLTPSPVLCELLDRHDILRFFDGLSFSDVVGHYKPARAIFEHALATLGAVPPERAAHVGDRLRTDVGGAIAMRMISVRYNGVFEDDAIRAHEADIVLANMLDLPSLLGIAEPFR
jgi:FMN phosphatase YigB (HAD superfamily)